MAVSRNTGRAEKKPYIGPLYSTAHFLASPRVRLWRPIEHIDSRDDLRGIAFLAEEAGWAVPYELYGDVRPWPVKEEEVMSFFDRAVDICRVEDTRKMRENEARIQCLSWISGDYQLACKQAELTRKWSTVSKSNAFAEARGRRPAAILCDIVAAALPPLQVQEKGIKAYLKRVLIKEAEIEAEIQAKAAGTLLIDTD